MSNIYNNDTTTFIRLLLAPIVLILSLLSHFRQGGRRARYLLIIVRIELYIDWIFLYECLLIYILLYWSIYVHNVC